MVTKKKKPKTKPLRTPKSVKNYAVSLCVVEIVCLAGWESA